jgi:hypothetical protein
MKILSVFKNVFLACALLAAFTGCSKDEDEGEGGLVGQWTFREVNFLYYIGGDVVFDAKAEGEDLSSTNAQFRGMFFTFGEDGDMLVGMSGQSGSLPGSYSTSNGHLTIGDRETSFSFPYRLSGNTLEFIWDIATLERMSGSSVDDEIFDIFDNMEAILTFSRK